MINARITDIQVFETREYGQFRKLKGNRGLNDSQINGIVGSINDVGYQPVPILVN